MPAEDYLETGELDYLAVVIVAGAVPSSAPKQVLLCILWDLQLLVLGVITLPTCIRPIADAVMNTDILESFIPIGTRYFGTYVKTSRNSSAFFGGLVRGKVSPRPISTPRVIIVPG